MRIADNALRDSLSNLQWAKDRRKRIESMVAGIDEFLEKSGERSVSGGAGIVGNASGSNGVSNGVGGKGKGAGGFLSGSEGMGVRRISEKFSMYGAKGWG
jgi:hypothetical protein